MIEKDYVHHYFAFKGQNWQTVPTRKKRKFLIGTDLNEYILTDGRTKFTIYRKNGYSVMSRGPYCNRARTFLKNHPLTTIFKWNDFLDSKKVK